MLCHAGLGSSIGDTLVSTCTYRAKYRDPTYAAYDVFMIRQMRLACFAAVDLVAIEVRVVCQPHCVQVLLLRRQDTMGNGTVMSGCEALPLGSGRQLRIWSCRRYTSCEVVEKKEIFCSYRSTEG